MPSPQTFHSVAEAASMQVVMMAVTMVSAADSVCPTLAAKA
jgi:hypothetical protein